MTEQNIREDEIVELGSISGDTKGVAKNEQDVGIGHLINATGIVQD